MDVFKRIGTQKRKFKLQFFIGRLKFSNFCPGKIYIVIRRGSHKKKSQQKLQMSEDYKLNFNKEILELQVTLFFDQKENKYQQKLGEINIVLLDSKQGKALLGVIPFNVAEYADSGQESIKQKKNIEQMPRKLEGLIEFNVFIKYIGQGGSESSLDKISDFFFGKAKQPESEQKIKQIQEGPGTLPQKKKKEDGSDEDYDNKLSKTEVKNHKMDESSRTNYVTADKQKKSGKQIDKTTDLSISKNFYFDQPEPKNGQNKNKKKDKHRSNSMQKIKNTLQEEEQDKNQINGKMSKTNWGKIQIQKNENQEDDFDEKPYKKKQNQTSNRNYHQEIQQLQQLLNFQTQQKKSYQTKFQDSEIVIKKLQKELQLTKSQNQSLKIEIKDFQEEIKSKQQRQSQTKQRKSSTKIQTNQDYQLKQKIDSLQHEIKKIQREKNQLIVQNSKLKEKYKQDFKKYEQILSQKKQQNDDLNETGKLELLRMKQQCVKYRQTIDKVTKQKNEKSIQLNRQRQENKKLDQQIACVKNTLSQMKIKLCNKLNEAIMTNDETMINTLMEINKDG